VKNVTNKMCVKTAINVRLKKLIVTREINVIKKN